MSAVHGIAWGLVEPHEVTSNFKYWRKAVRDELRTHHTIHAYPVDTYPC